MLLSLKTANFRKLVNHSFDFSPGLSAIRAANEAGKSTMTEAIGYALFGSEALRESLQDVVTWGEKESSLKVELRMQVNQNVVDIRRGKSGAELDVDGQLTVTGQKEVTRFVENLLGTAPKVAGKLMVASQASLRGALADGPTATAELIERLSNFQLIDEVIQLVVENLPSGSPVAVEQQIRTLAGQLEESEPGQLDTTAEEAALAETKNKVAVEAQALANAQASVGPLRAKAAAVREAAAHLAMHTKQLATLEGQEQQRQKDLAGLNLDCKVSAKDLDKLRLEVLADKDRAAARAAWAAVNVLKAPDIVWEGDRASFDEALAKNSNDQTSTLDALRKVEVSIATVSGKIIKETSCAFCGKDLKDVPEVALANSTHSAELAALRKDQAATRAVLGALVEEQRVYAGIRDAAARFDKILGQCAQFVEVSDTSVPAAWTWKGPDVAADAGSKAQAALEAAEAEVRRHQAAVAKEASLKAEGQRLAAQLQEAKAAVLKFEESSADQSAVEEEEMAHELVATLQENCRTLAARVKDIEAQIARARERHQDKVAAHAKLKTLLEQASQQLEELQLNNVLIKKLRGARPKVADKLWGVILSTVGYYFSQVRGVQSSVTKGDGGFRVDGKPVAGLSGSTLDALGLAIRIALTKTFLPNIDFLILDEPGSACDDDREANMLGTISTAGFDQVLLVTHSPLADSFADQVVTL